MVALRKTDYQHPDYRQQALDLIEFATQRTNIITFPTAFLGLLGYQHEAAILLNQILYWSSRTSDPEGWFYKTYDEWFNEIGLTRYQIERALNGDSRTRSKRLTLREIGVHTVVRKAPTGNPTVHYRIEMPIFIAYLEAFLFQYNTTTETPQSLLSIVNNVAEPTATESPNETPQSSVSSISKDSPSIEESKSLSDERISLYKSHEKSFGKLEKLGNETLLELLNELTRLGSRTTAEVLQRCTAYGKSWHYVLTALKNECSAKITENYATSSGDLSLDDFLETGEAAQVDIDETVETRAVVDFREILRRPPAPRRGDPIPAERIQQHIGTSTSTIAEMWKMAANQLELQLDTDFRWNCLRYLTLVDFEPETNCFVFYADNNIAADEMIRRQRTMTRMLKDVSGVEATFRTVRKGDWATVE